LSTFEFDKKATLHLKSIKSLILVQTDKATYKPEDKIQFRVLLLDSNTKPISADNVNIIVEDAEKNRVKQFENVPLSTGVYQNELQLTDSPVLGNWNINVQYGSQVSYCALELPHFTKSDFINKLQEKAKPIEVAKYVLPKFEVKLQSPPNILKRDGRILVSVEAKYTYGKPVKGKAVITGKSEYRYWEKSAQKTLQIDGKGTVDFDMMEELGLSDHSDQETVKFEVTFEDELTGKSISDSTSVTVHRYKYKMDIIKGNEHCKPGFPFEAVVKVTKYDGTPVVDKDNHVDTIISIKHGDDFKTLKGSHELDTFGTVKLFIELPEKTESITIQVFYQLFIKGYEKTANINIKRCQRKMTYFRSRKNQLEMVD
jgi:CD109 antigen